MTTRLNSQDDPWLPVWLEKLQPREGYFEHASYDHGSDHVARVMIHAWILGRRHRPELTQDLIAAAFVHDYGRLHDGTCAQHGPRAAAIHLPRWRKELEAAGGRNFDLIAEMVAKHCVPEAPGDSIEVRLFRNADGLDRVRLGDLKPEMLYDSSPELLDVAFEMLQAKTANLKELIALVPSNL